MSESGLEWVPTTTSSAHNLINRALVGGFEGYDGSALWVIRAKYEGDLVPGKLAVKHQKAYVPWGCKEHEVEDIEVCCVEPEKIQWVEDRNGKVPSNAVPAGNTSTGETLYVARAKEQGALTPGKVHPSHNRMVIWRKRLIPYRLRSIVHDLENVVSSEGASAKQKL